MCMNVSMSDEDSGNQNNNAEKDKQWHMQRLIIYLKNNRQACGV